MKENFNKAIVFLIKWEGYKSNHTADPGGLTIWGISHKFWPKQVEEMEKLSKDEALEIAKEVYRINYWDACECDKLPYPLDCIVFDTAVNIGVSKAKSLMDDAVNWTDYLINRLEYYNKLKRPIFMAGWTNRIINLYRVCKA